jgi:hypothetical protein
MVPSYLDKRARTSNMLDQNRRLRNWILAAIRWYSVFYAVSPPGLPMQEGAHNRDEVELGGEAYLSQ